MRPMPSKIPYRRVTVHWDDAEADPGWQSEGDIEESTSKLHDVHCFSIGWLIQRTKKWTVVAATINWSRVDGTWMFSNVMRVPSGMVRKVERAR